jgi:hypothetical protein
MRMVHSADPGKYKKCKNMRSGQEFGCFFGTTGFIGNKRIFWHVEASPRTDFIVLMSRAYSSEHLSQCSGRTGDQDIKNDCQEAHKQDREKYFEEQRML